MKKILSLLMLSAAIGASAQLPLSLTKTIGNNQKGGGLVVVPSSFTYGDHAYFSIERLVSPTDSEPAVGATGTFGLEYDIYDENLEKMKTISIYSYTAEYKAGETYKNQVSEAPNWTEAKERMKNFNINSFDEETHRGNTEEGDNRYFIWDAEDYGIYEVFTEHKWVPVGTTGSTPKINNLDYYDYDENQYPERGTYFTQTLFNDDELFEYIISSRSSGTFTIMQEGGKVLQTVTIGSDNNSKDVSLDIVKLNNKIYLVEGGSYQDMNFYYVKKGSSVGSAVTGDLTGDGEVNAADAVKLVDIIMGKK